MKTNTQETTSIRKDYLAGKMTHKDYYSGIANDSGISRDSFSPAFLSRVDAALAAGDKHLNNIPLNEWDSLTLFTHRVDAAFRARGDYPTMAGLVSLYKTAAQKND